MRPNIFSVLCLVGAATLLPISAAWATTENVVYSFKASGSGDGAYPDAALLNGGKAFYGTTYYGGTGLNGTIFKLDLSGRETVLHNFGLGSDGSYPASALTALNGGLYGVTQGGGAAGNGSSCGCGTVYRVTVAGTETVTHAFGNINDGAFPTGTLVKLGGAVYGTTFEGGDYTGCYNYGCGTVFKIAADGTESVVYSFKGDGSNGTSPSGTLIAPGGVIVGVARTGGEFGNGTVFSVTTAGVLTVIYSFRGGSDGANPAGGLLEAGGVFYGTTYNGGAYGAGTLFRLTKSGTETVLHSFGGTGDGANPGSRLIKLGQKLYGTMPNGGNSGNGAVYEVTPNGVERIVHAFRGTQKGDGSGPYGDLIVVGGVLYGTTAGGGPANTGTVFAITP